LSAYGLDSCCIGVCHRLPPMLPMLTPAPIVMMTISQITTNGDRQSMMTPMAGSHPSRTRNGSSVPKRIPLARACGRQRRWPRRSQGS
jgi:hypothetical protein